jgi:aspartyl/glutamyl-tRNA(Asn/Gln) amidotransferase C subunit
MLGCLGWLIVDSSVDSTGAEAPILRRAARVLLIDARDRLLMLRGGDPAQPDVRYWFTIGGGLEPGESDRAGAVRELFEECGLRAAPHDLIGPVHHEVAEFPFDGQRYQQDQVFFVLRVHEWTVDTSGFEPIEVATVDAHRWWSVDELRATGEKWYPPELADLLTEVLASVDSAVVSDPTSGRISRDDVAHLARLARLGVTDDELDLFAGQLDVILGAVARVGEVAAADIPPTTHAVPLENVFRRDEVRPCLPRDEVLSQAPAVEDDKFRVPQILAEEA